jgi:hypothetical protein
VPLSYQYYYPEEFMSDPYAGNPFYELKKLEMKILSENRAVVTKARIERLRKLAKKCRRHNPDAEESICYHGALALIHEADGTLEQAIRHREQEIAKIRRLHELELLHPTGGFALQNYRKKDLKDRERRLKALRARKT